MFHPSAIGLGLLLGLAFALGWFLWTIAPITELFL
jgi:hypothetical protein